ncbi:hypothetical protein EV363DRAFT_1497272 [Boletus edulis]|nr:hypothetical protein EV363DRAFT_1497272 [Boletus edulis]
MSPQDRRSLNGQSRISTHFPALPYRSTGMRRQPDCHVLKNGQLEEAEALLTEATLASQNPHHHVLASRAIVRARLRQWGAAIEDAKKPIEIQPSIGGYIANSVAFVGRGEKHKAYSSGVRHCVRTLSFHSRQFSPHQSVYLAVIVCMAGEHLDAISRVDDLIDTLHLNSTCYVVQAHMHLLHGKSLMRNRSHQDAVKSFKDATPPESNTFRGLIDIRNNASLQHAHSIQTRFEPVSYLCFDPVFISNYSLSRLLIHNDNVMGSPTHPPSSGPCAS